MLVISLRTLIIYLTLIVVMRFMGKRQIGEMQPFEFVITLIIADLAPEPNLSRTLKLTTIFFPNFAFRCGDGSIVLAEVNGKNYHRKI